MIDLNLKALLLSISLALLPYMNAAGYVSLAHRLVGYKPKQVRIVRMHDRICHLETVLEKQVVIFP